MKKLLAIWAGKSVTLVGKLLKKRTSAAPGQIALKICPDMIKDIKSHINKGIIVTCGTNGKTTTNNLIATALEAKGYKVVCNRIGANMLSGVVTTYVEASNILGKFKADYACFEIDEAYARVVFDYFTPDTLVITNLFRDQLDRYGEVDITSSLIRDAIRKCPDLKLVLNGDDPLCVQFGNEKTATSYYYGISEQVLEQACDAKEGRFCPLCGEALNYNYYHYSQLGDFVCPSCDFKRPEIDFEVKDVSLKSNTSFSINNQAVTINQKGFYNIYNIAAVYGALSVSGESTENFEALFKEYKPQTGRMQEFNFNKPAILSLSKNPAGFNQAISTVNTDTRKKDVIIAINDAPSDGQDISWLWDVDFDKIKNENLNTLTTSGIRMWDTALRFKYADILPDLTTEDMKFAIKRALQTDSEIIYLLVNYTAMYPTENTLNEILKEGNYEN